MKLGEVDEFQLSSFKSWKDAAVKMLHSFCQQFGKLSSDCKTGKGQFYPIPKKSNAKEYSNYSTISLISHASKFMLKMLQVQFQQYVTCEIPDIQTGFWRGRGTSNQIASVRSIMEKAMELQKNIYLCFLDYAIAFDWVDHNELWKILKGMKISDHLTFPVSWETCMWAKNQQLEMDMEQLTGSKLGKE